MHDTTRSLARRSAMGLALAALLAAPAGAQNHRFALGVGGGWSQPANLTPGLPTSTTLEPGWVAGLQVEVWPGSGRMGLRLGGSYMDRALEEDPAAKYGVASADLSLLMRVLSTGRERWVAPYLTVGAGASVYGAAEGSPALGGGIYGQDPVMRPVVLAGGGLDLVPSRRYGLRLEAVDRIVLPSLGEGPEAQGLPTSHGPQITAVIQLRGLPINEVPRVIAAQPAPAPAPAARPSAPAAAPAAAFASTPAPAPASQPGRPAAEAEMKAQIEDSNRRIALLVDRVDSLETALERAERPAAASAERQPAAPPARQASPTTSAPAGDGKAPMFTVQVGAYVENATAARWAERLRARKLPVWVGSAVVKGMPVSSVRVGVLTTPAEAQDLARVLTSDFGWPAWVDRVAADVDVPADAVEATRSFLRSN